MSMKKRAFISKLADESGLTITEATNAYNAFVRIIISQIIKGKDVALTGFGVFSLQRHKGHAIYFSSKRTTIEDYYVMKFCASDTMNKRLRKIMKTGQPDFDMVSEQHKSNTMSPDELEAINKELEGIVDAYV